MNESDADGPTRTGGPPVDPRLLRYAAASRGFFVALGVLSLAQTAVIVAFAWLLSRAVVGVIEGVPVADLAQTLALLAAVVAVRAVLLGVRERVAAHAAARVQSQLREGLLTAVGRLGPGWLASRNSAALAVTAGRGLDALEAYFGRYLPQLVQTIVATPLIIAVMWWQDWISGLTVILTLPLIPIFMVLIGLATRSVQRTQWATLGRLAARFSDTVQGLSTLKVFGRQHRAASSIEQVTEDYRRETMRVLRVSFLSGFALEFLASLSVAVIAVTIGFRLIDGSLLLSVGLFVLLLAPEAYLPVRQVGVQFHAAAEGVAATDDVFAVLDAARALPTDPSDEGRENADAGNDLDGALVLDAVAVRHGNRALPPVSLRALPGTVTVLSGPSGVGKSSVFAALRGAADYDGSARLDDADLRDVAPTRWLAWAGQQPGLIGGTVAENVALGDTEPKPAVITRALALACADDISPERMLGVQGAGLSGGQAQRVAVARAVYRLLRGRARVLALDEPSAALDADTEARLWSAIRALADDGACVLLVSHRTSAHAIADQVVHLRVDTPAREVTA